MISVAVASFSPMPIFANIEFGRSPVVLIRVNDE